MEKAIDTTVEHAETEVELALGKDVPKPLVEEAKAAALHDGARTRFTVVQAITHIGHTANQSPATRFRMEQLAGEYLAAA